MPSSPLSVRPVLSVLLTALLMAGAVLAGAPFGPAAQAATSTVTVPAIPPEPPSDSPVRLDLESLTPTALGEGDTVRAEVTVTNTSSAPLPAPRLELRSRSSRVTDREAVAAWQARTEVDATGDPVAASAPGPQLAPGESLTLQVEAAASELGYVAQPYFWGTRRISLTVSSEESGLASLYTFVVWRPEGASDTITQSVLLPVAALDPSAPITAPEAFTEAAESGRLADLADLAVREDVDWWLDPAMLDAPRVAASTVPGSSPAPPATDATDPTPAPTVPEYVPHPAAQDLATTLRESAGSRTVLAMPYAHADRLALQAADAGTLGDAIAEAGERVWEDTGITPAGHALATTAPRTDAAALEALARAGASPMIVPSASLRADPAGAVTPSSVGRYDIGGTQRTVLAPDPELSAEFSRLISGEDAEQIRQRLLAETATIASEYTTAPRHLLIAPDPSAALDAQAAGSTLDALADAPWIVPGRTGELLEVAEGEDWTTATQDESGAMLTLGELDPEDVHPTAADEIGRFVPREEAEPTPMTSPEVLRDLAGSWETLDRLGSVMADDAALDGPRLMVLSGASTRWRGMAGVPAERAREAGGAVQALVGSIDVVPASGYNLISDSAGVPITISNELDTPITVHPQLSSDRPLVQIDEQLPAVEVPARGSTDITVPVEAIANGTVELTVGLATPDRRALTEPVTVPLTVNPAWENWTTMLLVIGMGVLVVVGVIRARRTGASTRAPAVQGPEDPVELSRSGLSRPAPSPGHAAPTGPPGPTSSPSPTSTPSTDHDPQEDRA